MKLAETLRQRCLLSVSLCDVGRDFSFELSSAIIDTILSMVQCDAMS